MRVLLLPVILSLAVTDGFRRRTRRELSCEHGTYQFAGKQCCLCPKGSRVLWDCTDTAETKCDLCEDGTYMDHPNNDDKCQPCKICDSKGLKQCFLKPNYNGILYLPTIVNMKINERCSKYSNTVCGCQENYYCDKGDLCRACYTCNTCKEHGVKTQCTESNNTVCHDGSADSSSWVIGVVVVVVGVVIALVVVFCLWKRKKCCFQNIPNPDAKNPQEPVPLIDLNPHLCDVADVLGWKVMKQVALRTGMRNTDIEVHELNHPNDVKEQTYGLVEAWSQTQGLNEAYPNLIKTLRDMNKRRKVDEIKKICKTLP
ncbi:hypothetical protein DNTS_034761 [Danionella cerebrum]|uniref:Uncharacterized protein n=1 Tax=Danionella cerebrum TaxID=2873325 RepID=A0A553R962_9TELE|nr:hypothetical protein DNTS_034761 [Danionella translucida]TRY98729.1 hypothetical protein DNTS_034761 [Danionella translucida]